MSESVTAGNGNTPTRTDAHTTQISCIMEDMQRSGSLPAMAQNVADISRVTANTDTCAADLASVIMRDAGLCSNLITLANSAAFSGAEPIRTISRAVVTLGFDKVRTLASGLSILNHASQTARSQELSRLYASSYFTAAFSQTLARLGDCQRPEEMFLAGLLYQLPQLALANTYPDRFHLLEQVMASSGQSINGACQVVFGVEYTAIAEAIAEYYGLPPNVRAVLTGRGPESKDLRIDLISEAASLATLMFGDRVGSKAMIADQEKRLSEMLKIKTFGLTDFIKKTCRDDNNIAKFFNFTPDDAEMVVRVLEWGRASPAEVMSRFAFGKSPAKAAAKEPENIAALWAQFMSEMMLTRRREKDINAVLTVAQEALCRCFSPVTVFLAFHDAKRETIQGRFYAGSNARVLANDFRLSAQQAESPLTQCLDKDGVSDWVAGGPPLRLPPTLLQVLKVSCAMFMPVAAFNRPIGLCFVCRTAGEPPFTAEERGCFEEIANLISQSFEMLYKRKT